jgi:hypothetical protein
MPQSVPVDPSQCALLIMDYQPVVLDTLGDANMAPGSPYASPRR